MNSLAERVRGMKMSPMPKNMSIISSVKMMAANTRMLLKKTKTPLRTLLLFLLMISMLLRLRNNLAICLSYSPHFVF